MTRVTFLALATAIALMILPGAAPAAEAGPPPASAPDPEYPATDGGTSSPESRPGLAEGGSAEVDPQRLAAERERFIRANPKHEDAGDALLELCSQNENGLSAPRLREVAEVYRAANPDARVGRLGRLFAILDNLAHPYRSLVISALIFLTPVFVFALARRLWFHPEDPGRGPLTPRGAKVLFWVLTVLSVPLGVMVMIKLCPAEIVLIHFLGRALALGANGELEGQKPVYMAMIMAPMAILMVMNLSFGASAMTQAQAPRRLPRWLPQDYGRLLIGIWLGTAVAAALMFYLIFGGDYVFASLALSVSLLVPLFNTGIAVISPWYAVEPMPEGPVRAFLRETFARHQVPVKEIYLARSSLKMIEWLLTANLSGPVRCYLDPELLKLFTKNEFQAVVLHQIGHRQGNHRLKLTAAASAVAAVVLALILAGSLAPHLGFLIPGLFGNIMVGAVIYGLGRWERVMEREADAFVIDQAGLFQDHINAILKVAGFNPAQVDLTRVQDSPALRPETKRRVLYILERWRQAHVWSLPPKT